MRTEGLILDESDIRQESRTNREGGVQVFGKVNLITTNPTNTIEVRVSPELWDGGKAGGVLKQLVGKRMMFDVEYKKFSFADDGGKHVSMDGFHLFALPEVK